MSLRTLAQATGAVAALIVMSTPAPATAAPVSAQDCAKAGGRIVPVPWSQRMLDPQRAWPFARGKGVTVAVLDSGVDSGQPQLRGHVDKGTDFLHGGGSGGTDCVGHGTEVAGIIAAQPVRDVGFAGTAPGAMILPVTVSEQEVLSDGDTSGDTVDAAGLADAVRWAVDDGADVINMSLVLYRDSPELKSAVQEAQRRDVLVVAAVGNRGSDGNKEPYPAAYPGVLGVGAVGADGSRSRESQQGDYVDVVAPGVRVVTTARRHGQARVDGTSFATPFVSAVAALVRDRYPDLPANRVAERIMATANPAGGAASAYGHGIVDPYRAVTEPLGAGQPVALPALAPRSPDARAAAQRAQRHTSAVHAVRISAAVLVLAALGVFLALVVPRGRRHRWLPMLPEPVARAAVADTDVAEVSSRSPFSVPTAAAPVEDPET